MIEWAGSLAMLWLILTFILACVRYLLATRCGEDWNWRAEVVLILRSTAAATVALVVAAQLAYWSPELAGAAVVALVVWLVTRYLRRRQAEAEEVPQWTEDQLPW